MDSGNHTLMKFQPIYRISHNIKHTAQIEVCQILRDTYTTTTAGLEKYSLQSHLCNPPKIHLVSSNRILGGVSNI